MPGINEEKHGRIREDLIQEGRTLMLRYGPKKTTIMDITDAVDISKPIFYRYFDSKAELYLAILRRENEEIYEDIHAELDGVTDPREGLERLCWCYKEFLEDNPIIQQIITQPNYRALFRNVSPELIEEIRRERVAGHEPFIERLQDQSSGRFAEQDPVIVLGVLSTISLLVVNKEKYDEYDDEYYEQVMNCFIPALAIGLTATERHAYTDRRNRTDGADRRENGDRQ